MTETEAKDILLAKLKSMTRPDFPLAWVGDVVLDTPNAFILEGTIYADGDSSRENPWFCAVDKATGKSGMILPPPGPELTAASFKNFRWQDWTIV